MQIAYLLADPGIGPFGTKGASVHVQEITRALRGLGHEVTVLDNFFTGSKTSVSHWHGHPNFELVRHDVVEPFMIECDRKLRTCHRHCSNR